MSSKKVVYPGDLCMMHADSGGWFMYDAPSSGADVVGMLGREYDTPFLVIARIEDRSVGLTFTFILTADASGWVFNLPKTSFRRLARV